MDLIEHAWRQYPWIIDLALYFFLFGSTARVAFAKRFPGHDGRVLAAAVGLVLAASLTAAQERLGFSLESFGPLAAGILSLLILIVGYALLQKSGMPPWLSIAFGALFTVAIANAAFPNLIRELVSSSPALTLIILAAIVVWVWAAASKEVSRIYRNLPGYALERFRMAPSERVLDSEKKAVKTRLRADTRKNVHDEKKALSHTEKAIQIVETKSLAAASRGELKQLLEKIRKSGATIEHRCSNLRRLDEALKSFDLKWFRKMRGVHLGSLTPRQQEILRTNLLEQRKRLRVEEELQKLENLAMHNTREVEQAVEQAQTALQDNNPAGLLGWLQTLQQKEQELLGLEKRIRDWETRLLHLIKHQRRDLLTA